MVSYIKLNTCMCKIHQNFAHLVESLGKVLKPLGHVIRTKPDHFVKDADDAKVIELLDQIPVADSIKYKIWKSEKDPYINNKVRVQLVDRVLPQPDYMKYFKTQVAIFHGHVYQIKEQFIHIKNTKMCIRLGEIVIQMDFPENFTALEFYKNIQGTHWAKNHPYNCGVLLDSRSGESPAQKFCVLVTGKPA